MRRAAVLYTILRPAHGGLALRVKRKAVYALVPTGDPPSLRFGHPDVTTGDTAFLVSGLLAPGRGIRPRSYRGPALASLRAP